MLCACSRFRVRPRGGLEPSTSAAPNSYSYPIRLSREAAAIYLSPARRHRAALAQASAELAVGTRTLPCVAVSCTIHFAETDNSPACLVWTEAAHVDIPQFRAGGPGT